MKTQYYPNIKLFYMEARILSAREFYIKKCCSFILETNTYFFEINHKYSSRPKTNRDVIVRKKILGRDQSSS